MMEHNNLEEFRNGELYDATNALKDVEAEFFSDLAFQYGGPILDVACGTGRLTIPLAEQGYDITGVDITPEMLKTAKKKSERLGLRINWIEADVKQLKLERKYQIIFTTGNAFQGFTTRESQEGLLQFVHNHLDSDGVFAFETRNPVLSRLLNNQNIEEQRENKVNEGGKRITHTWKHHYDSIKQLEHYKQTYQIWANEHEVEETIHTRIAIRYVFPQELEMLLYYNGFVLDNVYGNFDRSPLQAESPLMVCICRKR
ncbi:class I SAM-dependent methyltransferase [Virgibacillus sp. NKC19-3]|uniref:class I SAM-dependent DNA methyltransferase n=1 Tax=Virgibacillus saliphilus TaxID=2831674 RepID=UPI001C9A95A5|nr:class I SAM-dependent methyltransferase [Virgibacillus sp. NKC19-3]MBY7144916.1 class I SAM-dependent methyltransferase [Virgibacillus sp. NKC19-3]